MADAKDCPSCGLVNPSTAVRCDCGFDFPTRRVSSSFLEDRVSCKICGVDGPTRNVSFNQHIGLVVMYFHSAVHGHLCKSCIDREFWTRTSVTAIVGWWGLISVVVTPIVLIGNVFRYLRCRGMAYPEVEDETSSSAARGQTASQTKQLVGQNCISCGERIPSAFNARYCEVCGSPVHDRCLRPGAGGCSGCGATVSVP